jgi:hypothetical protein
MEKTCEICGGGFQRDTRYSRAYFARQRFCSRSCSGLHRSRMADEKRPTLRVAFERYVVRAAGCWEWRGLRDKDGYGLLPYTGKMLRANVVALELDGRPVPKGMYGCHTCDNPPCVRTDHLYPGTPKQNRADATARGRDRLGEDRSNSKLTADDVRAIRLATGTHDEIAAAFGVARSNVSLIRERKTWKHVT